MAMGSGQWTRARGDRERAERAILPASFGEKDIPLRLPLVTFKRSTLSNDDQNFTTGLPLMKYSDRVEGERRSRGT